MESNFFVARTKKNKGFVTWYFNVYVFTGLLIGKHTNLHLFSSLLNISLFINKYIYNSYDKRTILECRKY